CYHKVVHLWVVQAERVRSPKKILLVSKSLKVQSLAKFALTRAVMVLIFVPPVEIRVRALSRASCGPCSTPAMKTVTVAKIISAKNFQTTAKFLRLITAQ